MRFFERIMNKLILAKMAKGGQISLCVIKENSKKPKTFNHDLLFRLLKDNANTEYGKNTGSAKSRRSKSSRRACRFPLTTIMPPTLSA